MSFFNLGNFNVSTFDMGKFVPVRCQEVLPGDKIVGGTSAIIRLMPQLAPFFTRVKVNIFHFFVPNRLVWEDWEDFITGGPTNDPDDEPEWPFINLANNTPAVGDMLDHLGVPPGMGSADPGAKAISALPIRAANLIWNEWGRRQELQTPRSVPTTSGVDTVSPIDLPSLNWYKDYFISCTPEPQKGPAISISLGTSAPLVGSGHGTHFQDPGGANDVPLTRRSYTGTGSTNGEFLGTGTGTGAGAMATSGNDTDADLIVDLTGVTADLTSATAVQINALRRALAYQRFSENRARYGSRYTEYLRAMGVVSPDERLQRPELLARGEQTLQVSEVLQTASTTDDGNGVGNLFGHGVAVVRSNKFKRYFPEHGLLLTFVCVRPDAQYAQGLHKMWARPHKEDYWQPELQHIGSQPVYRKELYALGTATEDETVFGYIDPYDDYRYMPSYIAGKFRPGENKEEWTLARSFATPPVLNDEFVTCTPSKRVFPITNEPVVWAKCGHSFKAKRLLIPVGTSMTI